MLFGDFKHLYVSYIGPEAYHNLQELEDNFILIYTLCFSFSWIIDSFILDLYQSYVAYGMITIDLSSYSFE